MTFRLGELQDVYFSVPGVATVRWDAGHRTVFVEWEGWAAVREEARPSVERVPKTLQVEYFGSVDEAREWIAR